MQTEWEKFTVTAKVIFISVSALCAYGGPKQTCFQSGIAPARATFHTRFLVFDRGPRFGERIKFKLLTEGASKDRRGNSGQIVKV